MMQRMRLGRRATLRTQITLQVPSYRTVDSHHLLVRLYRTDISGGPVQWSVGTPPLPVGGRFDPLPEAPYPYLYGAWGREAALVALAGALRSRVTRVDGVLQLPVGYMEHRKLCVFRLSCPVRLLSIEKSSDRRRAGVADAVCLDADRTASRSFAQTLRESPRGRKISGLSYGPGPNGRTGSGSAFVLWGDRMDGARLEVIEAGIDVDANLLSQAFEVLAPSYGYHSAGR